MRKEYDITKQIVVIDGESVPYPVISEKTGTPFKLQHHCQFTIPIEWEKDPKAKTGLHKVGESSLEYQHDITVYKVTKLRCACGEEWIRSDNE